MGGSTIETMVKGFSMVSSTTADGFRTSNMLVASILTLLSRNAKATEEKKPTAEATPTENLWDYVSIPSIVLWDYISMPARNFWDYIKMPVINLMDFVYIETKTLWDYINIPVMVFWDKVNWPIRNFWDYIVMPVRNFWDYVTIPVINLMDYINIETKTITIPESTPTGTPTVVVHQLVVGLLIL